MHTSGECLCHIIPTDAMVNNFGGKHKTQKKNYFYLVANLQSTEAKSRENFVPRNGISTQLINVTSCVNVGDAKIEEEERAHISSYQTFTSDKK
jgi:retron-type reverse transcriptase